MTVERPNTLAGLVEKRAEIAGQIAHTRAVLRQLIIDLDHVDAAIRIFDPSYDVEGIRQKLWWSKRRAPVCRSPIVLLCTWIPMRTRPCRLAQSR